MNRRTFALAPVAPLLSVLSPQPVKVLAGLNDVEIPFYAPKLGKEYKLSEDLFPSLSQPLKHFSHPLALYSLYEDAKLCNWVLLYKVGVKRVLISYPDVDFSEPFTCYDFRFNSSKTLLDQVKDHLLIAREGWEQERVSKLLSSALKNQKGTVRVVVQHQQ